MRSKSGDIQTIGDAIRQMLSTYKLTAKFDEATLLSSWEKIAGKPIARRTKRLYIRNTVLFVELDSPAMKHDFSIHKWQVLKMIQQEFGDKVVKEIVVM
jgi:predicted nucleic acid-binding Zn ribbon protein